MIEVRRASKDQLDTCLAIRFEVFVMGQGVPPQLEVDGHDPDCLHLLAWDRNHTVGTARLRITDKGNAKAERVAVRPGYQSRGVGTALMQALEDLARQMGHRELIVTAQLTVLPFYEHLGYVAEGPVFIEAAHDAKTTRGRLRRREGRRASAEKPGVTTADWAG
ncbi:MAG: GNAT family N-acetyltransferase [Deltaproteobacteria bacterium]|nr:GNAT family N-acetyltransferase [Deltaproteobacteria bacterium]